MKTYQELNLKFKNLSDIEILEIFKNFTQNFNDWIYLQKESDEHTKEAKKPSCILFLDDDYHKPLFLVTKIKDDFYSIVNIFNSQHGHILMLEYNNLLIRFEQDFQAFISYGKFRNISIKLSKEDIGLKEIISSSKTRDYFERYLRFSPQSYHPNDIERLDYFICAASRYCKKKINSELIEQYLVEDLNWPPENAKWCCNRLNIGSVILTVNKNFIDR
ncbi:MAG: hypothetical protein V7K77_22960 [Nostoc sp.]|uniref:hypothetical protein n=1 Tax=Nostoc sp. TaxID=1180 RepID=UPI002FF8681A